MLVVWGTPSCAPRYMTCHPSFAPSSKSTRYARLLGGCAMVCGTSPHPLLCAVCHVVGGRDARVHWGGTPGCSGEGRQGVVGRDARV